MKKFFLLIGALILFASFATAQKNDVDSIIRINFFAGHAAMLSSEIELVKQQYHTKDTTTLIKQVLEGKNIVQFLSVVIITEMINNNIFHSYEELNTFLKYYKNRTTKIEIHEYCTNQYYFTINRYFTPFPLRGRSKLREILELA